MVGIDGAPVIVAARVHVDGEGGAQGGVGAHGRQPEDGYEEVEREDRPDVVGGLAAGRLLGDERIRDYDEGEESLVPMSASFRDAPRTTVPGPCRWGTYADKTKDDRIHGESVDEETSEDQDEEGEECLETADDGNPQRGVDD